jgi:Na+-exporting ATPase
MNLRDNKVLLWCAVVLILATVRLSLSPYMALMFPQFPVVYIPTINNEVFLVGALKWEWGIVVCVFFLHEKSIDLTES